MNAEIARRDWISYINPAVAAKIERSLANAVLLATKGLKPESNEMDVLGNLAWLHIQHRDALAEIRGDCKQLEILLVPPLSRPIFLFSDEGACTCAIRPSCPLRRTTRLATGCNERSSQMATPHAPESRSPHASTGGVPAARSAGGRPVATRPASENGEASN